MGLSLVDVIEQFSQCPELFLTRLVLRMLFNGLYDPNPFPQAAAIKFEMRGGEWDREYIQMDGEPWKQPLLQEHSTTVEINKVPYHSLMINGEQ